MAASPVTLKLLIDTKSQRVLFAEAGKDFVDFLFNILSLPVGTVIKLLTKQGMVGCIGNLYDSIENLGDSYILSRSNRDTLLKPLVSNYSPNIPLKLPNMQSSTPRDLYRCSYHQSTSCRMYVSNDPKSVCPNCNNVMNQKLRLVNMANEALPSNEVGYVKGVVTYMIRDDLVVRPMSTLPSNEVGYVKGVVTYMIMDDLVVRPMSTISSITLLNKFNVKDVGVLEEKVIDLGIDEGVKLLRASLQSKEVLTDVFLTKNPAK